MPFCWPFGSFIRDAELRVGGKAGKKHRRVANRRARASRKRNR
jgi:hypothetical protein